MTKSTKEIALGDMALIAASDGKLIGYGELEAMYNAVTYHRRWWRRALRLLGFEIS